MSLCLSALFGDCVGIVIAYKDSQYRISMLYADCMH